MDLNRLTTGDQIIGVSGIVLFIFSFFDWLGISVGDRSDAKNAWSFPLLLIAVLIGIALVVYVALKAAGTELPALGTVTWGQIAVGLAGLAFLFVLIKLITGPSGWNGVDIPDFVDKDRKFGIFVGIVATGGLVAGAVLNLQAERSAGGAARPGQGGGPTV